MYNEHSGTIYGPHFVCNRILMRGKGYQGLAIVQIVKLTKPEVEMNVKVGNEQFKTGGSVLVQGKLIEHPKNIRESQEESGRAYALWSCRAYGQCKLRGRC